MGVFIPTRITYQKISPKKERLKKFLATYYHDGDRYGVEIFAHDFYDAESICKAHNLVLDGEHMMSIPAAVGSWLPNLIMRLRNFLH